MCVFVTHPLFSAGSGGVQQLEALSSLLQQTQQLQQLQAIQQRLSNGGGGGGGGGERGEDVVPAQISNMEPMAREEQPPLFNEVHACTVHVHVPV